MTPRERVLKALRRETPDRVPIHDGLWAETVRRWQRERLPAEIPPEESFGHEVMGIGFDLSPLFEAKRSTRTTM